MQKKRNARAFALSAFGFAASALGAVAAAAASGGGARGVAMDIGKQPHFAGTWVVKGNDLDAGAPPFNPFWIVDRKHGQGFLAALQPRPPYAQAYAAAQKRAEKVHSGDSSVVDYGALCYPPDLPDLMSLTFAMEILQTPGQVTLLFELGRQVRRVYTDGRSHPPTEDLTSSFAGHSIGHWEGGTLVIDTIGFKQRPEGLPFSEHARMTERFRLLDADTLEDQIVLEDPETLAAPWKGRWVYKRRALEMMEYVCEENNRNTADAQIIPASKTP